MRPVAAQLVLLLTLSTTLNYGWELAQTPLYVGVLFPGAFWHCFVASLGDGLLVLSIFIVVASFARSLNWYLSPALQDYLVMAAAGLTVAVAVEWWGHHIAQRWQYSEPMPIIPGIGIGAVPVLQMLLLPPAIFWVMRGLAKGAVSPATPNL